MRKQAMILSAGIGSRLGELTNDKPKALVEYHGKPLILHVLDKLRESGFTRIIVNVHHFANLLVDFLESQRDEFDEIIISNESELLDTGGGIKNASIYFDDSPILIHNVDIISNIDLNKFWNFHKGTDEIVSLAVKDRNTTRSLLMNDKNLLCGWRDNRNGDEIISRPKERLMPIAFSGIYILDKRFIEMLPKVAPYSIMTEFLKFSKKTDIRLYAHSADDWKDIGKLDAFQ
ncbi:MAG: NTP transferase domain-containing protein [Bacteroidales bacterium]|nr:NTP transferase domain-containing protein [Bacteroidales bacterium]